jgi:hypothetical protein
LLTQGQHCGYIIKTVNLSRQSGPALSRGSQIDRVVSRYQITLFGTGRFVGDQYHSDGSPTGGFKSATAFTNEDNGRLV